MPDADAFGQQSSATTNFGTDAILRVKNDAGAGTNQRKAYIRYDSSSLVGTVENATLNLNFVDTGLGAGGTTINWEFEVYGLNNGDPGEAWVEGDGGTDATATSPPGELTWNNAPANDTGSGFAFLANATSLGTFDLLGRDGTVNFTSSDLIDFLNDDTDGLVTFMIARNTEQPNSSNTYVHGIASLENSTVDAATLDVTLAVPEPATVAIWVLLGVIGMGYGWRRCRA